MLIHGRHLGLLAVVRCDVDFDRSPNPLRRALGVVLADPFVLSPDCTTSRNKSLWSTFTTLNSVVAFARPLVRG